MENSLPVAGHKKRFSAYLIDVLICWVLVSLLPKVIGLAIESQMMMPSSVPVGLALAYCLFKDSLPNGQSIGKRLLGLAVIDAVTYQDCRMWQSVLRNLVLMVLLPLEIIFALFCRRRLGDALASTMVIDAKVGPSKEHGLS
ncbi:MAG: RDD family protein [Pseudomonadaceae bacterium]